MADEVKKDVATRAPSKAGTLRSFFTQPVVIEQLKMALPKHLTPDRLLRVAMTSIQQNPRLLDCTQESLLKSVIICAQLGLEPDGIIGGAYLVPYFNTKKNTYEAQFQIGYRGMIDLAKRPGDIQSVKARAVYEKDKFEIEMGLEDNLTHKPYMPTYDDEVAFAKSKALEDPRGRIVGFYCVVKYRDGGTSFTFMSKLEVDMIRARSKSGNDGPWVTDYAEMGKKTVIRRHLKTERMSPEFAQATAVEDISEAGRSQMDIQLTGKDGIFDIPQIESTIGDRFEATVLNNGLDKVLVEKFVETVAHTSKMKADDIKREALDKWENFRSGYLKWEANQKAAATTTTTSPAPSTTSDVPQTPLQTPPKAPRAPRQPKPPLDPPPAPVKAPEPPVAPPVVESVVAKREDVQDFSDEVMIICPDTGSEVQLSKCDTCDTKPVCSAWE